MRSTATHYLCLTGLLLLAVSTGCQSWQTSSLIPGLPPTKAERLVVKQAKSDPFPSPSDVGYKGEQ